jgi:hypothetical protein
MLRATSSFKPKEMILFQSLSQGNTLLNPPNGGGIKFRKIMSMSAIHT